MESDDDETFLVVIGDDIDKTFPTCLQNVIVEEHLISEDSLDNVNEDPFIELSIKDEPYDTDMSCLEEKLSIKQSSDEEYSPEDAELSDDCAKAAKTNMVLKKRSKKIPPAKRHSYVQSLRRLYPELRKDKELLVESLVAIMKDTKPPPPPKDFYEMEGTELVCIECDHRSETIPAARRHYQEKHGNRYLFCLACGANFRSTTNLYKHEKHCDAADAAYVLRARAIFLGYKGRSRPFSKEVKAKPKPPKKFDCTKCSASFKSNYSLKAHTHMHGGERPYVCAICHRGYTSSIVLRRHARKHDESVRFECDHCQRVFNVRAALVAHLDTHRPLKRFSCAECGRRYAQRAALALHARREHRRLPPPCACKLCPRRYNRMSLLKNHMKKEHGMSLVTRNMFFKALPTLGISQVADAVLVVKAEPEDETACSTRNDGQP